MKIWVNHYGWICGGNPEKGLRFTKMKMGAKPFDEFSKETLETRIYIERSVLPTPSRSRGKRKYASVLFPPKISQIHKEVNTWVTR